MRATKKRGRPVATGPSETVQVVIPPRAMRQVRRIQRQEGSSLSGVVRLLVCEALDARARGA